MNALPDVADPTASRLLAESGWVGVQCSGRHAERYLNGQLTCDVTALVTAGPGRWFALLDVGGRLRGWGLLARVKEETFVLCVPSELVGDMVGDLEGRIIADDVAMTPLPTQVWFAAGPAAWDLDVEGHCRCEGFGGPAAVGWGEALPIVEVAEARDWWNARALLSGTPWGAAAPSVGNLVTDTGMVALAVARDKGCYLGQETVNKVLSGRGAARSPVWLELDARVPVPAVGDDVVDTDGRVIGRMIGAVGSVWVVAAVRGVRVDGATIDLAGAFATVQTRPWLALAPAEVAAALSSDAARRFARGEEAAAEARLRLALAVDPGHSDAYESLGVLCGRQGRYAEALELMDRLLAVDPDSVMAHSNKSLYFNQLGDIEKAEDEAREAAAASVRQAAQKRRDGEESARRERQAREVLQAREGMFRQVLDLDEDDVLANFALGELLVDSERFGEALGHLERAREHDPRHSAAHLALGRCLEGLGRTEDAVAVYRRGIQVASSQGDLQPANRMQARLVALS